MFNGASFVKGFRVKKHDLYLMVCLWYVLYVKWYDKIKIFKICVTGDPWITIIKT